MSVMDTTQFTQRIKFDQFIDYKCHSKQQDCNGNYEQSPSESKYDLTEAGITLKQLKVAIENCQLHDSRDEFLLTWLRVNEFNVASTEKMLRQSLEWRRLNGVNRILETYTPSEVLKKYFSVGQIGVDKFGCPVFLHATGRVDIKGILASCTKKEFETFFVWLTENYGRAIRVASERTGKVITQCTLVFDHQELSLSNVVYKPAINMGIEFSKLMRAHYPDYSRRVFIINAPTYFSIVYSLMKPFLHECDIPKVKIFGNNKNEWMPALLEEIDSDQLPVYYGGTMTDSNGDPKCPSKFNMGGKVPDSYYLTNNAPMAKDYMETISIIAGVSGRRKLKYKIDIPQSVISWEFMTEGGDIGFRIYSKDSKGHNELIPSCRVDSHLVMEEGQITCSQPGKYVFEFDNTHSYLRSKKLRYHIVISPPSLGNF